MMRWPWTSREKQEWELQAELNDHIERHTAELIRQGVEPAEARRQARIAFGGLESVKDECRDARLGRWLDEIARDLRFAVRQLRRSPLVSATIVLSLALGIGGSTALFIVFNALFLRPMDVAKPSELVALLMVWDKDYNSAFSYPVFERLRDGTRTLSGLLAYNPMGRCNIGIQEAVEPAEGLWVSGGYFDTLGVRAAVGRVLTPEDDQPDANVLVISDAYWRRRFGSDPATVGRTVSFNRTPFVIVGILPRGFSGTVVGRPKDVFAPLRSRVQAPPDANQWTEPFATWLGLVGRLRPGATLAQAQAELHALFQAHVAQDRLRPGGPGKEIMDTVRLRLDDASRGSEPGRRRQFGPALRVLLIGAVVLLMIVSLNIGTVLLARATARGREMTVRVALGAGRARLMRQLGTEILLLTAVGTAGGLAVAHAASRLIIAATFPFDSRPALEPALDGRVFLFALGSALTSALLFGIGPALRATRVSLHGGERVSIHGGRGRPLDGALMVAQVALSVVLLVGAGLLVRSLDVLSSRPTGYDRNGIFMFAVNAQDAGYAGDALPPVYRRVLDGLAALPGVECVGVSVVRPVDPWSYLAAGVAVADAGGSATAASTRAALNHVGPGFFETLRIPILRGRAIDNHDGPGAPPVAVISETMARTLFPNGEPLGRRLDAYGGVEIVGVAGDIRYGNLKDAPRSVLYTSMLQHHRGYDAAQTFYIRGADSGPRLDGVRAVLDSVDRRLFPTHVATLDGWARASLARERVLAGLSTFFGVLALLLVCLGLHGLMSYLVTLRVPELGLRLALGAAPEGIRALVLGKAARLVGGGLLVGVLLAYLAAHSLRSLVPDVGPGDTRVLLAALVMVSVSAFVAAWWPARRAARVEPSVALRDA